MKKLTILIWILILSYIQVSADYVRNIDDEYKIYQFDLMIWEKLEKSNNPEILIDKLKDFIFIHTWKTEKEILSIINQNKEEETNEMY